MSDDHAKFFIYKVGIVLITTRQAIGMHHYSYDKYKEKFVILQAIGII